MALECTVGVDVQNFQSALGGDPLEEDLVNAAKAGDAAAFEEIFNRFAGRVFRVARRWTTSVEEAEDVLQETFLKIFRNLKTFRGESLLSTWVTRIAVNEALMRLRRRRGLPVSIDSDARSEGFSGAMEIRSPDLSPEEQFASKELGTVLAAEVSKLRPRLRIVFELREIERLSTEETAEVLGLSVTTVKSRLLRARLKLRVNLISHLRCGDARQSQFLMERSPDLP